MPKKEQLIETIMDELNTTRFPQLPQSTVYQRVKQGLNKLREDELNALYVMLITIR